MGNAMGNSMGGGMQQMQLQTSTEDDDDDNEFAGNAASDTSLNYRPPNMEPIMGITDRRFLGRLQFWSEDKGIGFIRSQEFVEAYKADQDVFVHRSQKGRFKLGDMVEFSVFMNFRGKPQATELKRAHSDAEPQSVFGGKLGSDW
eukprot:TRINITY_DN15682_c0_g1_i1.p1 TRINITY_DN15682_c0_g1~~TRINITY_DN15682_c0_g1_i1.p1  ORF type:complete len:156 (-),score=38.99 TRINITY_DN15682_c0_g1_i1:246-680(-)